MMYRFGLSLNVQLDTMSTIRTQSEGVQWCQVILFKALMPTSMLSDSFDVVELRRRNPTIYTWQSCCYMLRKFCKLASS